TVRDFCAFVIGQLKPFQYNTLWSFHIFATFSLGIRAIGAQRLTNTNNFIYSLNFCQKQEFS
ncbi:hypothetical protein LI133_14475, partial [Anaerostipes hadrus]|nr:hypothetical protein [Anaerostipes hadrus]